MQSTSMLWPLAQVGISKVCLRGCYIWTNLPCLVCTSVTCGSVSENGVLPLSCDAGSTIATVPFVSFGTPTGSCLARFAPGSCAAPSSLAIANSTCVGWPSCALTASTSFWGGDPCSGTGKSLAAAITCSNPSKRWALYCYLGNMNSRSAPCSLWGGGRKSLFNT